MEDPRTYEPEPKNARVRFQNLIENWSNILDLTKGLVNKQTELDGISAKCQKLENDLRG